MLDWLVKLYGPFFSLENWQNVVTSGTDWLIILSLVLIECLLSVDNAVVLAAQTQALPTKKQQEESLFYGLWGAYLFRFLIIGLGTYLIHFWEIKIIGGGYLLFLVYSYFRKTKVVHTKKLKKKKSERALFWSVVAQIEFMDIIFSVDSVLASLAISENPIIVLIGGLVGILAMRGVAEVIMKLMVKIPELKPMAYVLIGIIAIKLILSIPAIDIEIPSSIFGIIVLATIAGTIGYHYIKQQKGTK
ncbi:TerC family protein [Lentilactobacillus laojiaonis]|uniref:TerC family protein n=1 Tax=Lentilactobacillus laojiaonis TaxID=2883998 RepID=UPI001D0B803C|nr:TerC family protein [Lentilactobacillus laojiaonis]UDM32068.1 TerC family protein [Lentilactobacillus laojiaonis]